MTTDASGWAIRQPVGDLAAKLILIAIASGNAEATRGELAAACECSAATVKKKLSYLVKNGWIRRQLRFGPDGARLASRSEIIFERGAR